MLSPKFFLATVRWLVGAGFCAGVFPLASAHPSSNDLPFVGLVVVPETAVRLTGRNQADYDCGRLSTVEITQVEHRFTLRNEGKTPQTITDLESNCHCTIGVVEKIAGRAPRPQEAFNYRLGTGQEMVIKVTVQLTRQLSGPMAHGVMVHVAQQQGPVARLFLTAEIEAGLMGPSELVFGPLKLGEPQSQTMSIACDARLLSGGEFPRLEAQCGTDAEGKASALIQIVPQGETRSVNFANSASTTRIKTYVVTVQPERKGELSATLFFAPISPQEYKGAISYDRAKEIFRGTQITVSGEALEK